MDVPAKLKLVLGLFLPFRDPQKRLACLPLLPTLKLAKFMFLLLLLLNVRSLPLAWHLRVFRPVFAIRLRYWWAMLRTMLMSRQEREKEEDRWLDSLCPLGQNPFEMVVPYTSWASIDDGDFNGHLSNSSYAKTCDAARFTASLQMFPMFLHAGGWIALAATHYNFIREIPIFASYEVRVSIQAWDHKWLYVVLKFVTKPKKPNHGLVSHIKVNTGNNEHSTSESMPFAAPSRTPVEGESITTPATPAEHVASSPPEISRAVYDISRGLKTKESNILQELDGAILHTVAVSQLCFKVGRITVPPELALAANGFSVPATDGIPYSHKNPPPSFLRAKKLMSKPHGGCPEGLKDFLKGGWREVSEGAWEKWWIDALGGHIEERRKTGLEAMEKLRMGVRVYN